MMTIFLLVLAIAFVAATVLYWQYYGSKQKSHLAKTAAPIALMSMALLMLFGASCSNVRRAILRDPTVISDAQTALEAEQERLARMEQAELIKNISEEDISGAPILGNPNGSVVLFEFIDYNCGHCKHSKDAINAAIASNSELKVVIKNFVLWPQVSMPPAKAIIAAQRIAPEKVAEFNSLMLGNNLVPRGDDSNNLSEAELAKRINATIMGFAKQAGIDVKALEAEMAKDEVEMEIRRTRDLAIRLGLRGTPAFVVGDRLMPYAPQPSELIEAVAEAAKAVGKKK